MHGDLMLGRQIRAARQLLTWARQDLADACGVSSVTLAKLETGEIAVTPETLAKVVRTLEGAGIELINDNRQMRFGAVLKMWK